MNLLANAPTRNAALLRWVEECIALCRPDRVHWCTGSEEEKQALLDTMTDDGTLDPLNPDAWPGCYLHRSAPNDVARVEDRTFICAAREEDAGPTNHWWDPAEARAKLNSLFDGCMRGRTMYVAPYVMGPPGSPLSKVGVEITDSPYVVVSMGVMTRMGEVALEQLSADGTFVPGLHSTGTLDPAERYICHFPETREIFSFSSNYGGNVLLGKKCFALRIASVMARDEGWMAEHMLILELTDPRGERHFFAAAFPSACGKTNLAMLVSPLADQGWTVRTVGDDIAWMRVGPDGRLWAINPEAGFFGVAPGTSEQTNRNAMATVRSNTIFTNVAVSDDGMPWWEGMGAPPADVLTDWKGNRRRVGDGDEKFAHPNSRFTAPARQCPSISPSWEDPRGVPISGIIFGGRRYRRVPLVAEAFSWNHGVFLGATMASRTTAAAAGQQNVLRRDPMAMLPFCGYHMGDYFAHWLAMGARIPNPPRLFHVNWFRQDADGNFLWPGYGENVRALIWMVERIQGRAGARETLFGNVPTIDTLHLEGLDIAPDRLRMLLDVDPADWQEEASDVAEHFARFGDRLPRALQDELAALKRRVEDAQQ